MLNFICSFIGFLFLAFAVGQEISDESLAKFLVDEASMRSPVECQARCDIKNECLYSIFKLNANIDKNVLNCFLYNARPNFKRKYDPKEFVFYEKNVGLVKKPLKVARCNACPLGWDLKYGSCYKSSRKPMYYPDAMKFCQSQDSIIAIPKTVQELNYLFGRLQKDKESFGDNTYIYLWLGGYSVDSSLSNYRWYDNTTLDRENPLWCENYPMNAPNYFCMETGFSYGVCLKNFVCDIFENTYKVTNLVVCQRNC